MRREEDCATKLLATIFVIVFELAAGSGEQGTLQSALVRGVSHPRALRSAVAALKAHIHMQRLLADGGAGR